LKCKENALDIIQALSQQSKLPLSIKTRTGINEDDKEAQMEMLVKASAYCSLISIHGRTTKQGYGGDPDWEFIYELKRKANKKCKIIGNGAIHFYQDIEVMKGDLDGIMIGQSVIGNPWIFTPHIPTTEEKKQTVLAHLDLSIAAFMRYHAQMTEGKEILTMPSKDDLDTIRNHYIQSPEIIPSRPLTEFRKHLFSYVK
jgi:tRNA-dihydrouridine synthase B